VDHENPLPLRQAKKLILEIIEKGTVIYSKPHALERMRERGITMVDCINILRAGKMSEPEFENGSWRYRIETNTMAAVIRLLSETELLVITVIRL
jgi:hypothetical protein